MSEGLPLGLDYDHHPMVRRAAEQVVQWFNHVMRDGRALVLIGPSGTGKTHIVTRMVQAYGPGARYLTESGMVGDLKAGMSQNALWTPDDLLRTWNKDLFLVIDDVGVAKVNEAAWLHDVYWQILDGRFEGKRPTVLTSNKVYESFRNRLGSRALDRLLDATNQGDGIVDMSMIPSYRLIGRKEHVGE